RLRKGAKPYGRVGGDGSRYFRRLDSLPAMRLFKHRVSTDDSQIHDSGTGRCALRTQDYSQGVLLPGLPFHLEQPGRTDHRPPLARIHNRTLPSMKWLFVLLLALVIFGGAAWFGYHTFVKEEIELKKEQRGEVTPAPVPDISLPEFQAAAQLRQEGKLAEAREALIAFIQKYPAGLHAEEAKDLLGEVNVDILLSRYPSPEKTEYVVVSGDVLAKIARKLK